MLHSFFTSSVKVAIRKLISTLPGPLRGECNLYLHDFARVVGEWNAMAQSAHGSSANDGEFVSMVCIGKVPSFDHWKHRIFNQTSPISEESFTFRHHPALIKGKLSKYNIVICPANTYTAPLFAFKKWRIVPRYINCQIPLRKPLNEILRNRDVKNELRVLRKLDYRFRVLRDRASFDEFYNEMLIPSVNKRHQQLAHVSSRDALEKLFERGFLLAAYREARWVGANLVVPESTKVLRSANVGWRDGDESLLKDRVVSALLHDLIQKAQADGYECLNLGNSNPFVDDGPLIYKLKWGAELTLPRALDERGELEEPNRFLAVYYNLSTQAGRSSLQRLPILESHGGKIRAIGWNSAMRPEFKQQIEKGIEWINLAEGQHSYPERNR